MNHIVSDFVVRYEPKQKVSELPKITSVDDVEMMFRQKWNDAIGYKESFYVMHLNNGNKVLGVYCLSVGGSTGVSIDMKEIVRNAILGNANHVIIAHNHPSGSMKNSAEDDRTTDYVKTALNAVGVRLTDHIILHPESGCFSYRNEDLL